MGKFIHNFIEWLRNKFSCRSTDEVKIVEETCTCTCEKEEKISDTVVEKKDDNIEKVEKKPKISKDDAKAPKQKPVEKEVEITKVTEKAEKVEKIDKIITKKPASKKTNVEKESEKVLTIKTGTIEIDKQAYKNDLNITEVHIPSSVKSIGRQAFYACHNLKKVIFDDMTEIPTIEPEAFCTRKDKKVINLNLTIKVPKEMKNTIKEANGWKRYANNIK